MKVLRIISKPIEMPHWIFDLIITFPRLFCGYLLAFKFGSSKFGMPWSPVEKKLTLFEVVDWFPKDVEGYGGIFSLFPVFFAWIGGFSETIGGLMLIIGFQTRIASFLILCTMLVAIFMQQIDQGLWNCLPALGFLWISLFYLILGSGRFGVDKLFIKN